MRHIEFIVRSRSLLACDKLIEFMGGDIDMGDHIALPQGAQSQFFAHALAILLVVHPLRRESSRQLVEGDFISAGDLLQRAVQLFVRDGEADALGMLCLNLL
jgi:hypothetical protein